MGWTRRRLLCAANLDAIYMTTHQNLKSLMSDRKMHERQARHSPMMMMTTSAATQLREVEPKQARSCFLKSSKRF